jgi:hypothetical protein
MTQSSLSVFVLFAFPSGFHLLFNIISRSPIVKKRGKLMAV